MGTKLFKRTILALSLMVLTFLIGVVITRIGPAPDRDPIRRAIKNASLLTDTQNEDLIRDWLFTLVLSGKGKDAVAFATRIRSEPARIRAYIFIADAHRQQGQTGQERKALGEALQVAKLMLHNDLRHSASAQLSARMGNVDEAFNETQKIADKDRRSETASDICHILIQAGDFDAAARAARSAVFDWEPPRLLLQVAEAMQNDGQSEHAKVIAQEAFELALRTEGGDPDLLERFAKIISRAGLGSELHDEFRKLEKRDRYIPDSAFEAVAVAFAESGDTDKALAVARGIGGATKVGRARALAAVSEVLRAAGHKDTANQILTEALDAALEINFPPADRSWAVYRIAPILVRAGRGDEALNAARGLNESDNEPLALVALALAESGKLDAANQALGEVLANSRHYEHTFIRSGVLIALVRATLKAGRKDDARHLVEKSQQKLSTIEDPIYKSGACRLVAEAFAVVSEWGQAVATADMCEQEIDKLAAYTAIVREHSSQEVTRTVSERMRTLNWQHFPLFLSLNVNLSL